MKYSKTEAGQQAFKQRSPTISARQRSMFILFDGQRTAAEVLALISGYKDQRGYDIVRNYWLAKWPAAAAEKTPPPPVQTMKWRSPVSPFDHSVTRRATSTASS